MTTWAKFFFYAGKWHFQGFTDREESVAEFEEFCVNENVISVVLALQHPFARGDGRLFFPGRPPGAALSGWTCRETCCR